MKRTNYNLKKLPIMETFYSIQGEGANTGQAAYFIRLAGCDVGCVWCDVKDSWDVSKHPLVSVKKIVDDALKYPSRNVVITGGEPLQHDLDDLCELLLMNEFEIWLETSGAYPLRGAFDWICFSPKKFKVPLEEIYTYANELKVVIFNKSDFKWAEEQAALVDENCALYLQPEWDKRSEIMPLIVDYVKNNPEWNISLQTHKYLNVP
jgi:7-carboxy-7-deazaguanine synthase